MLWLGTVCRSFSLLAVDLSPPKPRCAVEPCCQISSAAATRHTARVISGRRFHRGDFSSHADCGPDRLAAGLIYS